MEKIKVIINGKEITTTTGKTILEVVNENKLDKIPTLCHDDRLEPYGSCFLCVVEVEGMNKLVPSCATPVNNGMVITTNNEKIQNSRKTALELLLSNHYADCIGPCIDACPASVDAQGYVALISMGKHKEALKLIKEKNPFPLSIGRVCVRNCEDVCRRCYVDDPVAVNYLKRYVADKDMDKMWIPDTKRKNGKKVAIVGGGPSGLTCAYFLTLEGYSCTIFEKLPELGGMLKYGIPSYRLPRNILDSEIKWITDLGVEVKTNIEMGKDFSISDLKKDGFDAIFLGVGAHKAAKMRLDKEDEIKNIFGGIDFLRKSEINGTPKLNGTVIIVGGGNTAIDAARTSLRSGANNVKIVYRRSIKEMPAHHAEIEAAQEEGIDIMFLTNPKTINTENGKLKGIECLKMELEKPKNGGRPRPIPIVDSEFNIDCNYIISAIGQQVNTSFLNNDKNISLNDWGTIDANETTFETSISGVFSGGDVVTGPLTAVSSIGQGRKAAFSIIEYLKTGKAKGGDFKFFSFKHKLGNISENEFSHFDKIKREKMPELKIDERKLSFEEVELGITDLQAQNEPLRCLECGCSEYYDCTLRKYADDFKIDITDYVGEVRKFKIDNLHPFISLDPNKCINCGKCVRTCSEILKVSALGFVNRGFKSVVKPAMEKSLSETNCIACGNCIDACPTGAISEKFPFKVLGTLPKTNHKTICNFCSLGCNINYKVINNDIFYISNTTDEVINSKNDGYLCVKGRFGNRYLNSKNKIEKPAIKIDGKFCETDLEEAINFSKNKINDIIKKYGSDSVAVFGSPKMSNEELYLIQKLARTGLKTNNISSFSNMLYNTDIESIDNITGATVSTMSINNIKNSDVIVVLNSNLSEENLIMELKIKEAQKKGVKLIVISSSEIKLTKFADLWIDTKKGTNTILINGLLNEILNNSKNVNEDLKDMVSTFDSETTSEFTEVDLDKYKEFLNILSKPDSNVVFVYNIDSIKEKSKNDLKAIGNYLSLTNRINKENNGIIILREFSNSTGLMDMGCNPVYLPGYVKYNEKSEIEKIEKTWKTELKEIFKPADIKDKMLKNKIKAVLIFGEDPLINKENIKLLNELEFLMVFDAFDSESAKEADVIIPASTYIKQHGTYTSCDTLIQKITPIFENANNLENWEIISKFANSFCNAFNYDSQEDIFKEIKKINRIYKECDIDEYWNKNSKNRDFLSYRNGVKYQIYDIDTTPFEPEKPSIHYSDNYYRNNVKNVLI